jgi:SPP1 gp7 family putative phage head morphogenesis protein
MKPTPRIEKIIKQLNKAATESEKRHSVVTRKETERMMSRIDVILSYYLNKAKEPDGRVNIRRLLKPVNPTYKEEKLMEFDELNKLEPQTKEFTPGSRDIKTELDMMHWEIIKEGLISSLKVSPKQIAEYTALCSILAAIAEDLNKYTVKVSNKQITKETLIYTNNVINYTNKLIDNTIIQQKTPLEIQKYAEEEYKRRIENSADRMVYTRDTFLINETLRQSPDKKYVYRTKEDIKVCGKCRALNGQVFKYGEAMTGVNYPPMHQNCRCIVIPYEEWEMR